MLNEDERLHFLNDLEVDPDGQYVLYWMQASQRTRYNHALEYAISAANSLEIPPVVTFCLTPDYPEATVRHYSFMLDGLRDVAEDLKERGVRFHFVLGEIPRALSPALDRAALIVTDRGYLRHQRRWRMEVAESANCRVVEVETDVVVPVETASDRREYAARTIRPKIERHLESFLSRLMRLAPDLARFEEELDGAVSLADTDISRLKIDRTPGVVSGVVGGMNEAQRLLKRFLDGPLDQFDENRNDPVAGANSELSPYLHFGHVSPVDIVLAARRARSADHPGVVTLTEELVVRRELSRNFVWFESNYDEYQSLPEWARLTLDDHRDDPRPHLYSYEVLQSAMTHDPYWNAAMREMKETGRMRGYMRMYWGKKVLEWSNQPEEAFETLLTMNNAWFLDGRDPNSWANVGWIFGLHDRPWKERPIFGKVRYMNDRGLHRKFDIEHYVDRYAGRDESD